MIAMKHLQKNCLLVVKVFVRKALWSISVFLVFNNVVKAQTANFISNGSFEDHYECDPPYHLRTAKYWLSIDSSHYGGVYLSTCNQHIPLNVSGYQYPKSGNACIGSTIFYPPARRGYLKNRLKQNLSIGKIYCVKFHVNITNTSPRGMDGFGIYFGDNTIDTITKCTIALTYLNPQVKNPIGNVISDTLNWVPITGTFVANGTEKYALIGNFLADDAVITASINTPFYPANWTDVLFDDVSCIEVDLRAYASPDQSFIAGDSVFIGREPDFAIDPGCVWYQLPLTTPIATISGLWVKPVTTTTYVVRQELECSPLKWDTVVVYQTAVGLNELNILNEQLKIYPVPADDRLELKIDASKGAAEKLFEDFNRLSIYNNLGQLVREEEVDFKEKAVKINTSDLKEGVYFLLLRSGNSQTMPSGTQSALRQTSFNKRFVIAR